MENDNPMATFLPHKVYEALRWLSSFLIEGVGLLLVSLNTGLNWGWDNAAILCVTSALSGFIGFVFLGSKKITDYQNK